MRLWYDEDAGTPGLDLKLLYHKLYHKYVKKRKPR